MFRYLLPVALFIAAQHKAKESQASEKAWCVGEWEFRMGMGVTRTQRSMRYTHISTVWHRFTSSLSGFSETAVLRFCRFVFVHVAGIAIRANDLAAVMGYL